MKINEIFKSLQGEGLYSGTPCVFIRMSGCNLKCDFCDTRHESGTDMSEDEIVDAVSRYATPHVVITGGEPMLQLTVSLLDKLHDAGKYIHIETNGTIPASTDILDRIDWITCSPKYGRIPKIRRIDELKIVFDVYDTQNIDALERVADACVWCYLQPCDRQNDDYNRKNIDACIRYITNHRNAKWKLSLQIHKMLGLR